MSDFKPYSKEQSKELQSKMEKDLENAVQYNKEGHADVSVDEFKKHIPEHINVAHLEEAHDISRVFYAAGTAVAGRKAVDTLHKNKDLEKCTATFNVIGAHLDVGIQREKEVRNPGNGEITTKYGSVTVALTDDAARKSVGLLKTVNEDIADYALKKLSK